MTETTMPAAEAVVADSHEKNSYELAFHILPTVAEGEVPGVFDEVKALITKAGGEISDEETPERFDLAYEIIKRIEGKNRRFQSAYFGWVRFTAESEVIEKLVEEVGENAQILRHLLIRLTKAEEENPFRFHEALVDQKMVTTVEESKVVPDVTTVEHKEEAPAENKEEPAENGEVDEQEIEKALEKEGV